MRKTDSSEIWQPTATGYRLKVTFYSPSQGRIVSGVPLYLNDGGKKLAVDTYNGLKIINRTSVRSTFVG